MKKTIALLLLLFSLPSLPTAAAESEVAEEKPSYIKWIDFDVTAEALADAAEADIASHGSEREHDWVDLLAFLGQKYGGNFRHYRKQDLIDLLKKAKTASLESLVANQTLYRYYQKAYGAVLSGMLGEYTVEREQDGVTVTEAHYGVSAFSPIARGYSYSHYDDFGAARSYGYRRHHLGHDMMGSIGTPIIATEGGVVEALGWNQYGGWRIGIRSFDGKRYYYYAHLRRDHPYAADLYRGKIVAAGDVIGYLGMTGYSAKENVNNINVPHLHYGLQIIFDPSQKEGWNQIWVDCYALTSFLAAYRSRTLPSADGRDRVAALRHLVPETPD